MNREAVNNIAIIGVFIVLVYLFVSWAIKQSETADKNYQNCVYHNNIDACLSCEREGTREQIVGCKKSLILYMKGEK